MSRRKLQDKLIHISKIDEELILINGSDTDFITKNGNVYTHYGNDMFLLRAKTINNHNKYVYVNVRYKNVIKQRRLHILIAETFIENDDIEHKTIVMHIDNNKNNNSIENLKWGTISENTKQAYDDGLVHTDKGFDDSQSLPVVIFDVNLNLIKINGSVSITSQEYGVTKGCILYQCKHKVKDINKKPRCGLYFRFLSEYEEKGFVL